MGEDNAGFIDGVRESPTSEAWDPYVTPASRRDRGKNYLGCWLICPASLAPGIAPHAIEVFERRKKRIWRGATCTACGAQVNSFGPLWALDSDGHTLTAATEAKARFLCEVLAAAKAINSSSGPREVAARWAHLKTIMGIAVGDE